MKQDEDTHRSSEDPILILDIKMIKDKPEKISIYENDDPEEVVEKFCQKHNLEQNKRARLLNVIKKQI